MDNTLIKKSGKNLRKALRIGLKKGAEIINDSSAKHHRYDRQSGNLDKAKSVEVVNDFLVIAWLDGSVSGAKKYALAIHNGHSGRNTKKNAGNQTWKPDQFMFKAAKKEKKKIEDMLEGIVNKYTKRIF